MAVMLDGHVCLFRRRAGNSRLVNSRQGCLIRDSCCCLRHTKHEQHQLRYGCRRDEDHSLEMKY